MKIKLLMIALCALQTLSVFAFQPPNWRGYHIMGFFINGTFVEMDMNRIASWKYEKDKLVPNGQLTPLKVWKNKDFPEYTFKCGDTVVQENRFWVLSCEITYNKRDYQGSSMVVTGTVDPDGTIENLKKVRPLPYVTRSGRALIHDNKIWFMGGNAHDELIYAEILADGELGEWKYSRSCPTVMCCGGFVYYKNCFYANGIAHFALLGSGSDKMYAMKVPKNGGNAKWVRVDSPENARGRLYVYNDALYYFDEVSGNIYKTVQEEDGIQLKDWQIVRKMPSPPKTEGVGMAQVPDGWFFFGGVLRKNGKYAGAYNGTFIPFSKIDSGD